MKRLPLSFVSLHLILVATHRFAVILICNQSNINPMFVILSEAKDLGYIYQYV